MMGAIASLLALIGIVLEPSMPETSWFTCKIKEECTIMPADYCGCGGGSKNLAIRKDKEDAWKEVLKYKQSKDLASCIAEVSNDWSCHNSEIQCLDNKCELIPKT